MSIKMDFSQIEMRALAHLATLPEKSGIVSEDGMTVTGRLVGETAQRDLRRVRAPREAFKDFTTLLRREESENVVLRRAIAKILH
jgi:hypothetical protein